MLQYLVWEISFVLMVLKLFKKVYWHQLHVKHKETLDGYAIQTQNSQFVEF